MRLPTHTRHVAVSGDYGLPVALRRRCRSFELGKRARTVGFGTQNPAHPEMCKRKKWVNPEDVLQFLPGLFVAAAVVKVESQVGPNWRGAGIKAPRALQGAVRGADLSRFRNASAFASWLGLSPEEEN